MILINNYTKLSTHVASMSINDRPIVKQIMLTCTSNAKFLFKRDNAVHF